ncbi:MAG: exodeoxyribonuclease VII large subunit, partial [Candidatus Ornithospirochaeta sp.]
DNDASLPSVVFRSALVTMPRFKNGDLVIATGRISLYEKTGKLSFIINKLTNAGDGELQALLEKRKLYYQNLGWFDIDKKKPLPKEIKTLGIVTSATGAVFHDILDVTRRRAPSLNIVLFPCAVQGKGAEITIASRIRQANNFENVDVLIVGRGGGSQEDLSPFSTDEVIEAIHESKIPIVSAVGHEVDWALSDYVADVRAGTPSIAAEMVTKDIFERRSRLSNIQNTMRLLMEKKILLEKEKIPSPLVLKSLIDKKITEKRNSLPSFEYLSSILEKKVQDASYHFVMAEDEMNRAEKERIEGNKRRLEGCIHDISFSLSPRIRESKLLLSSLKKEMNSLMKGRIEVKSHEVFALKKEINALSPLSVLNRGYALVRDENGKIIRNKKDVKNGDTLYIRVEKGEIRSVVQEDNK